MKYYPRKFSADFPLHVTVRTNGRLSFPLPAREAWEIFADYTFLLSKFFRIQIHAFVMMPNHLHIILRAPDANLSEAMSYFLRETSKEFGRKSGLKQRLWGGRYHSSLIGSPLYYLHAYKYVYRNPVRARLVKSPFEYRYSTLGSLVGLFPSVIPIECDDTLFENFNDSVRWLESPHLNQEQQSIQRALRRKNFELPRSELTKKPNALEFRK